MKLDSREWNLVVVKLRGGATDTELRSSLKIKASYKFVSVDDVVCGYWYRTNTQCFAGDVRTAEDVDLMFADVWKPQLVSAGQPSTFAYPVYFIRIGRSKSSWAILAPYASLLGEIIEKLTERGALAGFVVADINKVLRLTKHSHSQMATGSAEPRPEGVVLRGATIQLRKAVLAADVGKGLVVVSNIRLRGVDLRSSVVFDYLVNGAELEKVFELGRRQVRVSHNDGALQSVIVGLDWCGNYHLRPGPDGVNLIGFQRLLEFLMVEAAVRESDLNPRELVGHYESEE